MLTIFNQIKQEYQAFVKRAYNMANLIEDPTGWMCAVQAHLDRLAELVQEDHPELSGEEADEIADMLMNTNWEV